jgi:hypothetical protein
MTPAALRRRARSSAPVVASAVQANVATPASETAIRMSEGVSVAVRRVTSAPGAKASASAARDPVSM